MGWYDEAQGIHNDNVVGWAVWFSSGAQYCSLSHTADQLPDGVVQCMWVWWFQSRDPDYFAGAFYTQEEYPIPHSDRILRGGWTDMENHDTICKAAAKEWWPPSWIGPLAHV